MCLCANRDGPDVKESTESWASGDIDVTGYLYAAGQNRLTDVSIGGAGYSLSYDANGSITRYDRIASGDDKYIAWNPRNLPEKIVIGSSLNDTAPTARDEFAYGPDGRRFYKQTTWDDNGTQKTEHTFYAGRFEELVTEQIRGLMHMMPHCSFGLAMILAAASVKATVLVANGSLR